MVVYPKRGGQEGFKEDEKATVNGGYVFGLGETLCTENIKRSAVELPCTTAHLSFPEFPQ
jgi:hypothetical protein